MTSITWDPGAREFLRKLPKEIARRIYAKVDTVIANNVERFLETLANIDVYKIRVGDYRLFVDYNKNKNELIVRAIRHRKNAYKKS